MVLLLYLKQLQKKYLVNQLSLQILTHPVVGDFNYFGINYNGITFDTDKDVKHGEYLFVLTTWYDQQRILDSAFRIAKVDNTPYNPRNVEVRPNTRSAVVSTN